MIYQGQRACVVTAIDWGRGERVVVKSYWKRAITDPEVMIKVRTICITQASFAEPVWAVESIAVSRIFQVSREVMMLRELNHPYIIRGLASWSDDKCIYLSQEFAQRGDLAKMMGAPENFSPCSARRKKPF